jgi:hypothetical protein
MMTEMITDDDEALMMMRADVDECCGATVPLSPLQLHHGTVPHNVHDAQASM